MTQASLILFVVAIGRFEGADLFVADLDGANLNGVRFLECAQLTAARNWQSTSRDDALACGEPILALEIE